MDEGALRNTGIAFMGLGAFYLAVNLWSTYQAIQQGMPPGGAWSWTLALWQFPYLFFSPAPYFAAEALALALASHARARSLPPPVQ